MKRILAVALLAAMLLSVASTALAVTGTNYNFKLVILDRNGNMLGEYASNWGYTGDLGSGMNIYPAILVTNNTNRYHNVDITLNVDSKNVNWGNGNSVNPNDWHVFYSSQSGWNSRGEHNYIMRKNGSTYDRGSYHISTMSSAELDKRDAPNWLRADYVWWENLSGDKLQLNFRVNNNSTKATVSSYTLWVYAKDAYGNDLYDSSVYYDTTYQTIAPGSSGKSTEIVIPNRSRVAKLYCGIYSVTYTNGTTYTYQRDGSMRYTEFNYKK